MNIVAAFSWPDLFVISMLLIGSTAVIWNMAAPDDEA
jgi:hypothetical protein